LLGDVGITSFAQNAQAELITINIGLSGFPIGAINGGVPDGDFAEVNNFPISGNTLYLLNNYSADLTGLDGAGGLGFAIGNDDATPVKFSLNDSIGVNSSYTSTYESLFRYEDYSVSPDFGAGSYMGFKTSQNNYGWLKVTWTASSDQFQILSGAYESTPNVAIRAGAGPTAPIPEPGTWAAMAIFAGGAAFAGWRRRRQQTL
jgi:hypothetical protein